MLYLTLNQAFKNQIDIYVPDEVMKIIYQYVISLNNKIKINNLFDIYSYDYKYEQELKQKSVKQLKDQYKNINQRFLKQIKNKGKNNNMVKQDYVDKLCYGEYIHKSIMKFDALKDDKISHYNVNTKKYITRKEHKQIRDKYEQDYNDDLKRHMTLFQQTHPQYNISMINNDIYYSSMEVLRYGSKQMNNNYKKCRASGLQILIRNTENKCWDTQYVFTQFLGVV